MSREAMLEARYSWFREHIVTRIIALFDLVLNIRVLIKRRDVGEWLVSWMLYLGIVGATLTAIIVGATRAVIYAANTVPRPHALPIISPELERFFISWPQLAIGMGYHAHIITGLYFAAPAYTAALIGGLLLGDRMLRNLLFPDGYTGRDILDHVLLAATFILAWSAAVIGPYLASLNALAPGLEALAPHIAVSILWLIYTLAFRGLGYRLIGTALALLSKVIINRVPEALSDLRSIEWCKLLLS